MSYQELRGHHSRHDSGTDRFLKWMVRVSKIILVLLVLVSIYAGARQPMMEQQVLRSKLDKLRKEAASLQGERDKLLRKLNWIETDVNYLEQEVRDRFHLYQDGEFVLRFED